MGEVAGKLLCGSGIHGWGRRRNGQCGSDGDSCCIGFGGIGGGGRPDRDCVQGGNGGRRSVEALACDGADSCIATSHVVDRPGAGGVGSVGNIEMKLQSCGDFDSGSGFDDMDGDGLEMLIGLAGNPSSVSSASGRSDAHHRKEQKPEPRYL